MSATKDPNAARASGLGDPPRAQRESAPMPARDPRDPAWFRQVLGQYPTGVSVITGIASDGTATGLVVGSFTSVSLDPPLIAFLPDRSSSSWPKILPGGRFCVNVLAHDQGDLCRIFAARGGDKFAGVSWRPAESGSPVLDGVVAWIDCELESAQEAGDHFLVIGRVLELDIEQPQDPLLFFRGGYGRFAPLSLISGDTHMRKELRLADRARPEMEALARDLRAQCVAWSLLGDELVLLASAGEPERRGVPASMIGVRLPVVPPVGAAWIAFEPAPRVEAWLARASAHERQEQRERLNQVRERGYTVALISPEPGHLDELASDDRLGTEGTALRLLGLDPLDFGPAQAKEVATLTVPAFGPDGHVELLLGLHGFRGLEDEAELERYVSRLRHGASEIMSTATAGGGSK